MCRWQPGGSSVNSSWLTWPRRSLAACTFELKPFASFEADWPMLREEIEDEILFQFSILSEMVRVRQRDEVRSATRVSVCFLYPPWPLSHLSTTQSVSTFLTRSGHSLPKVSQRFVSETFRQKQFPRGSRHTSSKGNQHRDDHRWLSFQRRNRLGCRYSCN